MPKRQRSSLDRRSAEWRETYATLHMWTQIVGKVAVALAPPINHFWSHALQITSRGLPTVPLTSGGLSFTMTLDFVDHQLVVHCSDGTIETVSFEPRNVADFYRMTMDCCAGWVEVRIWPMAVEIPNPVRLQRDLTHHSYDPAGGQCVLADSHCDQARL